MALRSIFLSLLLTLLAKYSCAQIFSTLLLAIDYPGISDNCALALNTTLLSCPSLLGSIFANNPRLTSEQLEILYTSACKNDLTDARLIIAAGCNETTDIVSYDDMDRPATLIIDRFIYRCHLSCRKDPTSGQFCDTIFTSWFNQTMLTTAKNCSDCMLGVLQTQLNSPFGHDDEFAEDFAILTSSCSTDNCALTSPAIYAINTSATAPPSPDTTATCSNPYIVQAGDSCDTIALAHKVSTYAVISAGGKSPTGSNLIAGSLLCLPEACKLYRVQFDDTCDSILSASSDITDTGLLSWNPNINIACGNIQYLAQTLICLRCGSFLQANGTMSTIITSTTIPNPGTPTQSGIVHSCTQCYIVQSGDSCVAIQQQFEISFSQFFSWNPSIGPNCEDLCIGEAYCVSGPTTGSNCARWYTVQRGDSCALVSLASNIALSDFYFLNPSINSECSNLLLGVAYCVLAVGSISTYSGYPSTSQLYTLAPLSFSTTTSTFSTVAPIVTPISELPIASRTKTDCKFYVDYTDIPTLAEQANAIDKSMLTDNINNCNFVTTAYGVDITDLLAWNPFLALLIPCMLQPGFRYCVSNGTLTIAEPIDSFCLDIETPYPGTVDTCSYYTTIDGNSSEDQSCDDLTYDFNISIDQLLTWNPWFGSDCDVELYVGLSELDTRAICVGVTPTVSTIS